MPAAKLGESIRRAQGGLESLPLKERIHRPNVSGPEGLIRSEPAGQGTPSRNAEGDRPNLVARAERQVFLSRGSRGGAQLREHREGLAEVAVALDPLRRKMSQAVVTDLVG